ncbi:MAG: hypothetical protein RR546_04150 [Erysipelotrichaceae bacterium]
MISSEEFIAKIHDDSDNTCYGSILRSWDDYLTKDYINKMKYIKEGRVYDRLYPISEFLAHAIELSNNHVYDSYFSLNSFWRDRKSTQDVRHLNSFVLDFDYYAIEKYKNLDPLSFYNKYISKLLPLDPTALVDSGRGLYVIYSFEHCPMHCIKIYKAIYQMFLDKFESYGMDPKAMNITQVIRIPGTYNSKSGTMVEVLDLQDTEYKLTDFTSMLPYTKNQCIEYKNIKAEKIKQYEIIKEKKAADQKDIDYERRKNDTRIIIDDLSKLIVLRNRKKEYIGYREKLIYLVRERLSWSGCSPGDEISKANDINKSFHYPLSDNDVMDQCNPSKNRRICSIKKIISLLKITKEEQRQLKTLKHKSLKDSCYNRRHRRNCLLNMTEKQRIMYQRRTSVIALKRQGLRNYQICNKLSIDKGTVSKDLKYVKENAYRFKRKIEEIMADILDTLTVDNLVRQITYDEQKKLRKWLEMGQVALE